MSETCKSITKSKSLPKKVSLLSDDQMLYSFKSVPINKAIVDRLSKELFTWLDENPLAKSLSAFLRKNGINPKTYYKLLSRHPDLKESHEMVLHELGERLWGRAVEKQVDWAPVKHRLWRYSPEFKEDFEFHATIASQIKNSDGNDGKTQYIVVDTTGKKLSD